MKGLVQDALLRIARRVRVGYGVMVERWYGLQSVFDFLLAVIDLSIEEIESFESLLKGKQVFLAERVNLF